MYLDKGRKGILVKRKVVFSVVLVLVVALSVLALISYSERFIYFEELAASTIRLQNGQYISSYASNFTDRNGNSIASIDLILRNTFTTLPTGEAWLILHHAENVEIDSMVLNFKSPTIMSIYLKSDPSDVGYSFWREVDGITLKVEDFRWLGKAKGDADFNLIFQNMQDKSNDLTFTIDLLMHYKAPIQLTGIRAYTSVNMLIPNGEAT